MPNRHLPGRPKMKSLLLITMLSLNGCTDYTTRTIAYESSNQSMEGMIAVGSVIKTRMQQRNLTAKQVVLEPHQFSCWHPKTQQPTQNRRLTKSELRLAKRAWDLSAPGKYNHYATVSSKPYWAKSSKSSIQIERHVFYEL